MNEPLRLAAEAPASETFEVSRSFETFYDAERRTLFRRLWLVTGNREARRDSTTDISARRRSQYRAKLGGRQGSPAAAVGLAQGSGNHRSGIGNR